MKKQLTIAMLAAMSFVGLLACQSNETELTPFNWADATVTNTIEVSPQSPLSIKAPNLLHRGINMPGVPETISVSNFSENQLITFLKEIPTLKGKDDNAIRKSIADGNINLFLSYSTLPSIGPKGVYLSKDITLKPDLSNLKDLDITLDIIQKQSGFENQANLVKSNGKSYFLNPIVMQLVTFTATDKTSTLVVTTKPSWILKDENGTGNWRIQ